ncbi:hypothetical protein KY290_005411 [Solanum tuberosum]|uniref:Uncharacterized protein n=1 Tax=Solanum tuberosum TaxID=4113 RepID=A0ABQ7WE33_SOLTU|nr:hypothetical protein KY289_005806 [Solanum tuberosum]KAH0752124.1 hypothetical protein KY285_005272 [Solanum tuberosum]KAH0778984.1 hypothetical protein KY290_005411 [Solanum tuberosum]
MERKTELNNIERMLKNPIEELGMLEKVEEVELEVMQLEVCRIVFLYQILESALALSGDE